MGRELFLQRSAAGHCQKAPADFYNNNMCLGRARLGQGRIDEAIQLFACSLSPWRGLPDANTGEGWLLAHALASIRFPVLFRERFPAWA